VWKGAREQILVEQDDAGGEKDPLDNQESGPAELNEVHRLKPAAADPRTREPA
jgi:hypothetical protein